MISYVIVVLTWLQKESNVNVSLALFTKQEPMFLQLAHSSSINEID